jgi:hypothetical protein
MAGLFSFIGIMFFFWMVLMWLGGWLLLRGRQ